MSSNNNIQHFIAANEQYAATFDKGDLPVPPSKQLLIVTCMDSRIDPLKHLGLNLGEAHIIRNAGGIAKDAIRSIIISQHLLKTREIAVFRHTNCGMVTFTNDEVRESLRNGYDNAENEIQSIDFLPFKDLDESVKDDVDFLASYPLVHKESVISGWVYDCKTGKIRQVAEKKKTA